VHAVTVSVRAVVRVSACAVAASGLERSSVLYAVLTSLVCVPRCVGAGATIVWQYQ